MLFLAQSIGHFLIPYEGGDSPVIQILIVLGFLSVVGTAVGVVVLKFLRNKKFVEICRKHGFSEEERGLIQSYLTRFHMTLEPELLTQKRKWDLFCNRVSHQIESDKVTEEELEKQAIYLDNIRGKLKLTHSFEDEKLISSRVLPVGYPITVSFIDPDTGENNVVQTTVLRNNDLFLGIKPPEGHSIEKFARKGKLPIRVSFARDNDSEYYLETLLVRTVNFPALMWYVRHPDKLGRSSTEKNLKIPAFIMVTPDGNAEDVEEVEASIHSISAKECTFTLEKGCKPLKSEQGFLLNFEADENSFCWGGMVTNQVQGETQTFYRSQFKNVSAEDSLQLAQFLKDLRIQQKPTPTKKS